MNVSNTSLDSSHYPVMLNEVIKVCSPEKGGNFVDCTFGGGGYSKEILKYSDTKVIAIDRDQFAIKEAAKIKKKYINRFQFFNEKFSNIEKIINKEHKIDAIIFDLGISKYQLLDMSRGFSFYSKEKIDMNMGLASISAEEVINNYNPSQLKLIFKLLGEEREASIVVRNIIKAREIKPITHVTELVKIIEKSKKKNYKKKINVCTKIFQALRIFVNKETTELIEGITKATKILKPGGKLIIVSFHSIEDKIIKFYFNNYSANKSKPSRYLPDLNKKNMILFDDYKNKFLIPSENEIIKNPPSRSAKLRFATRNKNSFLNPEDLKYKFKQYLDLEGINA